MDCPLQVLPYPPGKTFAVTWVDDTDHSTVRNTRPVYALLYELGFRGTKTVWPLPQQRTSAFRRDLERTVADGEAAGSSLEDPEYRRFVLELQAQGFEIALHGVAAGNSYRAEILRGTARFRDILGHSPRINVFHATNLDNAYAGAAKLDFPLLQLAERLAHRSDYQGHVEGSPYFWGDILRERIRYVRLPFHTIPVTNTLRLNPSMPFHDPRRPFVSYWFASSDGSDCGRFVRLLSDEKLQRLRREAGASIIYTHFASGFARPAAAYRLDPDFVDTLQRLRALPGGWFPTASELLDRLLLARRLSIQQEGHEVTIWNPTEVDAPAVALRVPRGLQWLDETGVAARAGASGLLVLPRVGPYARLRFISSEKASREYAPRSPGPRLRLERLGIELMNYYGLLRDHLPAWPRRLPASGERAPRPPLAAPSSRREGLEP